MKSKVVSSKMVLKAKFFDVKKLSLSIRDKKTIEHHIIETHPIACVIPITEKKELYIISQYRYMMNGYVLGACAGFIENGETALSAAKRELQEETGITAGQWELLIKIELSRSVNRSQVFLFLARDLDIGIASPEEDEDISLVKIPLSEAVSKIFSGEITHAPSIIGILILDKLNREKKL